MRNRNTQEVTEIREVEIKKSVNIAGHRVVFNVQTAKEGTVNGKKEILDEALIDNTIEKICNVLKQNTSKYFSMPNEVVLGKDVEKKDEEKIDEKEREIINAYEPRYSLEQVALNTDVRKQILTAISAIKYRTKLSEEWGMQEHFSGNRAIILNFYGKPGTGKSMSAEAIAKALGKKVYQVNYAELESKYVGETPKNIRKAFEIATKENAVLIFDEADSFLGKRLSSVTQSADYGVNITRSVLLMELEKFTGVVVFTTNLISNYDDAFKRRILLNVYFELPDEKARETIWKLHLTDKMPLQAEISGEKLAVRYAGISGADIKDMVFYAALFTLEQGMAQMDFSVFDYAYGIIKERYIDKESKVEILGTKEIPEEEYEKAIEGEQVGD